MIIDKNELFVVERGLEYCPTNFFGFPGIFTEPKTTDTKPRYDRSYNCSGQVYQALEVCDKFIAAKCVHSKSDKDVGKTHSFNTAEMELMTVTQEYLDALLDKVDSAEPSDKGTEV